MKYKSYLFVLFLDYIVKMINDENKKNEILDKEIKNNNLMENENYLELLKEKNKANDSFRIHKNKFDIMKNKNTNHINKFFNDFNYYIKDEGNIENRQDKVYMKAINKILNNKIKKACFHKPCEIDVC